MNRPFRRPLLVLALLACAGAAGAEPYDNGSLGRYDELPGMPTRFVRFDAADVGYAAFTDPNTPMGFGGQFVKATFQWNRLRFGAAFAEGWVVTSDFEPGPLMGAPVYVGYDLWHNRKRTWFFYGAVPDVYAEVGMSFVYTTLFKAALCCDVDYYGVGVKAEAGRYVFLDENSDASTWFACLQLRLLTFGIGF